MDSKILAHVDALFKDAPNIKSIADIREELLSDLNDKFTDLTELGKSSEEAFNEIIGGIGDIDGLIREITTSRYVDLSIVEKRRNRAAASIALAVAFFAVAGGIYALLSVFRLPLAASVSAGSVSIVALAFLVFGIALLAQKHQHYVKEDDSFVEEYKEKITTSTRKFRLRKAASSFMWTLLVAAYFFISFLSGRWDITWVMFVIGAIFEQVISAIFSDGSYKFSSGIIYTTATVVYFIASFSTHRWDITWIIFLVAVALQQAIRFFKILGEK